MRSQQFEVRLLLRRAPRRERERGRLRHLADELRRNAGRLLVVPARDTDQACFEGLVLRRLLQGTEILEQAADVRGDEALLREAAERSEGLRACGRATGRHHHALVPEQEGRGLREVGDLREPGLQLLELLLVGHAPTMLKPPSHSTKFPVMWLESSEARNTTTPTSSSGPGMRSSGVLARMSSRRPERQSSLLRVDSVSMKPGPSALTRTRGAKAPAYAFVRPSTPYLEAAYCGDLGL